MVSLRFLDTLRVNCEAVLLVNRSKFQQVLLINNFHRNLDIWYKWALNGFSTGSEKSLDCKFVSLYKHKDVVSQTGFQQTSFLFGQSSDYEWNLWSALRSLVEFLRSSLLRNSELQRQRNLTKYNRVHFFLRDQHNGGLSTRTKHTISMLWFFKSDTRPCLFKVEQSRRGWAGALMRELFTAIKKKKKIYVTGERRCLYIMEFKNCTQHLLCDWLIFNYTSCFRINKKMFIGFFNPWEKSQSLVYRPEDKRQQLSQLYFWKQLEKFLAKIYIEQNSSLIS